MSASSSSALASASFRTGAEAARPGCVGGTGDNFNGSAFDEECFSVNQGIGNLFMCGFENPSERLARNAHFFRSVGLIQSFKVGQTYRLELIDG